jgi:hypothetical protein
MSSLRNYYFVGFWPRIIGVRCLEFPRMTNNRRDLCSSTTMLLVKALVMIMYAFCGYANQDNDLDNLISAYQDF